MKLVAYVAVLSALGASASARQADPALDDLSSTPQPGPSELDILSEGAQTDFPDIEAVKARKPVSVTLRALNKITAKYADIEINIGETAKYRALEITPRYCDKRPPEEFPETTAFVEIVDKGVKQKSDFKGEAPALREEAIESEPVTAPELAPSLPAGTIFSGWMFKSSPALNGVEHPVYDVWVIDCKTVNIDN